MLDRLMEVRRLLTSRTIAYLVQGWAAAWFGIMAVGGGSSWHFFLQGAAALANADDPVRGGLHMYAARADPADRAAGLPRPAARRWRGGARRLADSRTPAWDRRAQLALALSLGALPCGAAGGRRSRC
ncbi:hypothetical protein [Dactylosporangium sp. CA-233914]|uniref:hypothetical protein n=1 Tax=Dactylosporangium sp. CA-233914 TaxID=3239934 RepID=UPI003D91913A